MTSYTFCQLLDRFGRVEIPTIQRDYVQGRNEQKVVRDGFLSTIYEALTCDDANRALDLDFVYGSLANNSSSPAFQPLDGQQRLTTLFLLHWYLAWQGNAGDDFRNRFAVGDRSRFGYEVRPSSRDFINALATHFPSVDAADCTSLSGAIKNEPWYFRGWRLDPTIQSALDMLDTLHERFVDTSGLYHRLVDETKPSITFQLLELEKFGLSDDLYIKMNARGKPLTAFETFKARFEDELQRLFDGVPVPAACQGRPVAEFFSHRIDTAWSEFFWPFRDHRTATFDEAVMNLLRAVIIVTRSPEAKTTDGDLTELRRSVHANSYDWFHSNLWLDENMVTALIALLEYWCEEGQEPFRLDVADKRHFDEEELFRNAINKPSDLTYLQYVQLCAYVQYLIHKPSDSAKDGFASWIRVTTNLAENTEYAGSDDLRRSFTGLLRLAPHMNDILVHLSANTAQAPGFNGAQFNEERVKAHLIQLGDGWPERIARAEQHDYFRGQIGFLLRFSGIDLDDADGEIARLDAATARGVHSSFDHYFSCAEEMIRALTNDPAGSGILWERALLVTGDFLPLVGSNYCLLVTARDEPGSWKSLLRDAGRGDQRALFLKDLWDQLSELGDFEGELVRIVVEQDGLEPWRSVIISTPGVYRYGSKKMLRFVESDNEETLDVYLLSKSQMNGRHAELFTFCLKEALLSLKEEPPFKIGYEEMISTEEMPYLTLSQTLDDSDEFVLHVYYDSASEQYEFWTKRSGIAAIPTLRAALEGRGFDEQFGEYEDWLKKHVAREDAIEEIHAIGRSAIGL